MTPMPLSMNTFPNSQLAIVRGKAADMSPPAYAGGYALAWPADWQWAILAQ
jgi:hypothetical protein